MEKLEPGDITHLPPAEAVAALQALRGRLLQHDAAVLHAAAAVLRGHGASFLQDIIGRLREYLPPLLDTLEAPLPLRPPDEEQAARHYHATRKEYADMAHTIRNRLSDGAHRRLLYEMTWELPDADLAHLLALFREAIMRYRQRHKDMMTTPPAEVAIHGWLAQLGITPLVPAHGDLFHPLRHMHAGPAAKGFNRPIAATTHMGYQRHGRILLKPIVEIAEIE